MTLPATDAFSLGLAHSNSSHSRRTSPRLTRSPSPKISFTSSPKPLSSTPPPSTRKGASMTTRKSSRRGANNGVADGHIANGNGHIAEADEREDGISDASNIVVPSHVHQESKEKQIPKAKIDWEIPRKILHSSIGFIAIPLYISHAPPKLVVLTLSTTLAVVVPADVLRLRCPAFARLFERVVGFLMRESEKQTTNGVIWYLLGVIIALSAYPTDLAVISVLILSWADTAASTFGRLYGRFTPPLPARLPILRLPFAPRKSVAGFAAATLTGACIAAGFWGRLASMGEVTPSWTWEGGVGRSGDSVVRDAMSRTLGVDGIPTGGWIGLTLISIVAGLASGIAEALDLGALDDNLTLPIISGGCLWGFFKLLQYVSS